MKEGTAHGNLKGFLLRHQGTTAFGCLLFILLVAVIGYGGMKIGKAYWNYFELRQKTREALSWAVAGSAKPEGEIVNKVIANASEVGVGLANRDIQIIQTSDTLTIIVSWIQAVEFPYYTLPLKHQVALTEEKRWYKGGLVVK